MTTSVSDKDGTIASIEDALDTLVRRIMAHRAALPKSTAPLTATPIDFVIFDQPFDYEGNKLSQVLSDPVEWGLRSALKELGRQVFRITGSTGGMLATSERVADRYPGQTGRVMEMLDSAWDGVGSEKDRWYR